MSWSRSGHMTARKKQACLLVTSADCWKATENDPESRRFYAQEKFIQSSLDFVSSQSAEKTFLCKKRMHMRSNSPALEWFQHHSCWTASGFPRALQQQQLLPFPEASSSSSVSAAAFHSTSLFFKRKKTAGNEGQPKGVCAVNV
ncbi:hypothetical protein FQA47_002149 [Oryzias melastigma]|uniref:Uncharacterized protein n=1 Tax=Oryzias melastigma TaxID=30732 RepID=A0A834F1E4_ORYME|nr:hypothetical protein FQA47_002149 [Oryzias melastigma]